MSDDLLVDLDVAIITTDHAIITEGGDNQMEIELILQNSPVCVAEVYLEIPEVSENYIKHVSEIISTSIDAVEINCDRSSIFIGKDPYDETSGLVVYQDFQGGEHAESFFKRWEETRVLLFEYCVKRKDAKGNKLGVLTCVRGVRVGDVWKDIRTAREQRFTIDENF